MVSTRLTQCQSVIPNNLRKSSNNDVVRSYYDQCDQFKYTKEIITQYRKIKENRITNVLTRQSVVIKSIWDGTSC